MTDAVGDVKRFTPDQQHAIEHREGELLLDAGAGSGKTLVLVERFARAVEEDRVGVNRILTITFTDKAAAELRERIRARLRAGGDDDAARATEGAWISTIHAFCARLLRTHALDAGLDPEFSVIEEPDGAQLRRAAADAAIAACARTEDGAELIASLGIGPLRATLAATYDELRARGALEPELPPAPRPPTAAVLRAAAKTVKELARVLQRELGEIPDPGHGVVRALERLELVGPVLAGLEPGAEAGLERAGAEPEPPWPGELEGIRLGKGGGAALKTDACEQYGAALDELGELARRVFAAAARDGLDALLREYGARYTALKRERSVLDFTDLELLARELLRRPEIGDR
ncbi:MAG: UvrD-helicase domain-containing protein, partial [Conexibacteraceae bacterium]|nr:UvrD-helicase domain-containing protein [Conexibacteraceae bacterium]